MHDDVIKWKHFPCYLPFVRWIHTGHWWIPLTKSSNAELWCFLWLYPPQWSWGGGGGAYIGFTLSVRLSVCPLTFRVRPVASAVLVGFFPYLVQMINGMRGCVACDDPWPWPISSRSFGIDLENHVCSVASTVLDGFFLYLTQMITIIRECVACYVLFRIWKFEFLANFRNFSALIYSSR